MGTLHSGVIKILPSSTRKWLLSRAGHQTVWPDAVTGCGNWFTGLARCVGKSAVLE